MLKIKILFTFVITFVFCSVYAQEEGLWDFKKKPVEQKKQQEFSPERILLLQTIRIYQMFISKGQGDVCNFTPSCSYFAYQAIKKYGLLKGSVKAIDRLQRCNPYSWNYIGTYYKVKWVRDRGYKLFDPP
ncbi:MAG: hypothetical protein B5M53_02945 [Candidatus Cloacimonas sp. 4484_209]|nr:MAG: hypothetical protein B5M53_02945 [Candidatus Cloacimonas sp. 4484_209]